MHRQSGPLRSRNDAGPALLILLCVTGLLGSAAGRAGDDAPGGERDGTAARGDGVVFAGVPVREPSADAQAERIAVLLAQALEADGVADLGTPPLPAVADSADPERLTAAVDAALTRYQEADFVGASERAASAADRFEETLAFVADAPWDTYARALLVRSLAERKQGNDDGADAALRRLAVLRPDTAPDPALATPSLLGRWQEILDEVRSQKRVEIELVSTPAGAEVIVDGVARGASPLVVGGLLPGEHFVSVERAGHFVHRVVDVSESKRVAVTVGDERLDAAHALRAAIRDGAPAEEAVKRARTVGDDVIIGLFVPAKTGQAPTLVLARVRATGVSIVGTALDDKATLKPRVLAAAAALLGGGGSADGVWLDGGEGALRPLLFPPSPGATGAGRAVEDDGPSWLLLAGVGVGIAVVLGASAGIATVLTLQSAERVEVVVDASKL